MSSSKISQEQQRENWLKTLEPKFDLEYMSTKAHFLDGLHEGVITSGLEKIREMKKSKSRIMYVSEHLSEQDFIEEMKLFYNENLELPAVFGGTNLLVRGLTRPGFFIQKPLVVDLEKCGLIGIERELLFGKNKKDDAYKRLYLEFLLGSSSVESVFHRFDSLIFHSGRAYDGKVRHYNFHTLESYISHAQKDKTLEHLIFPIALSTERCIEDTSFQLQHWIKQSRLPIINDLAKEYKWADALNRKWRKQTGKFGAVGDIISFLLFYSRRQPRGEFYIDFAEPIHLSAYQKNDKAKLLSDISSSIHKNIRVTPTSLVAAILKNHGTSAIYKSELIDKIEYARNKIPPHIPSSNYLKANKSSRDVLERAMLFLDKKRTQSAVKYSEHGDKYIIHKDSYLLNYYSNRIAHHNITVPHN